MLKSEPGVEVVGEAPDGAAAYILKDCDVGDLIREIHVAVHDA